MRVVGGETPRKLAGPGEAMIDGGALAMLTGPVLAVIMLATVAAAAKRHGSSCIQGLRREAISELASKRMLVLINPKMGQLIIGTRRS